MEETGCCRLWICPRTGQLISNTSIHFYEPTVEETALMTRPHLILLIIAALFSFSGDAFATSVVPGWHTTIYSPFSLIGVSLNVWLCLLVIGYWFIIRKQESVRPGIFLLHLLLTLPMLVYMRFPWFVPVHYVLPVFLALVGLFIIGQGVFLTVFFKSFRRRKINSRSNWY